jgi:hypothetical protein
VAVLAFLLDEVLREADALGHGRVLDGGGRSLFPAIVPGRDARVSCIRIRIADIPLSIFLPGLGFPRLGCPDGEVMMTRRSR